MEQIQNSEMQLKNQVRGLTGKLFYAEKAETLGQHTPDGSSKDLRAKLDIFYKDNPRHAATLQETELNYYEHLMKKER